MDAIRDILAMVIQDKLFSERVVVTAYVFHVANLATLLVLFSTYPIFVVHTLLVFTATCLIAWSVFTCSSCFAKAWFLMQTVLIATCIAEMALVITSYAMPNFSYHFLKWQQIDPGFIPNYVTAICVVDSVTIMFHCWFGYVGELYAKRLQRQDAMVKLHTRRFLKRQKIRHVCGYPVSLLVIFGSMLELAIGLGMLYFITAHSTIRCHVIALMIAGFTGLIGFGSANALVAWVCLQLPLLLACISAAIKLLLPTHGPLTPDLVGLLSLDIVAALIHVVLMFIGAEAHDALRFESEIPEEVWAMWEE